MRIRTMTLDDLETVLGWAREEGWNPGLHDARAFLASDPDGFLIGEIDGNPVAAVSVVQHAPDLGFLGLYLVRDGFRGQGLGFAIWQAGMARLEGRTVGLDGVVAQQPNYRRSGFALSHRNVRFSGAAPAPAEPGAELRPLDPALRAAVAPFDAAITGYARPRFLDAWLAPAPSREGLALVRDGVLTGYGVARGCVEGTKIGPLYAAGEADAETLFRGLAAGRSGPVILDVPEPNAAAVSLAGRLGLAPVFETARMWRGPAPAERLSAVWGVATFELG